MSNVLNVQVRGECGAIIWATTKDGKNIAYGCSRIRNESGFCFQHSKEWIQPKKMRKNKKALKEDSACTDCTHTYGKETHHTCLYEHFGTINKPTRHFIVCYSKATNIPEEEIPNVIRIIHT